MAETGQGAIVPASGVPNPTPNASERATAILAWVIRRGVRTRHMGNGVFRAYVTHQNGRLEHVGPDTYGDVEAAIKAYERWREADKSEAG